MTAFGDGMIFALGLSDSEAARRVYHLARQIETTAPGVLAFNLHPENIAGTRRLHLSAIALAQRPGWVALGLDSYLDWLHARNTLLVERVGPTLALTVAGPVRNLAIRIPTVAGWKKRSLPPWSGRLELRADGRP